MRAALGQKFIKGGAAVIIAISIPLVMHFEGLRTQAYIDPVGIETICYGSTSGVKIGDVKTPEECRALLHGELAEYLAAVDRILPQPMPDTRRAALVSFSYNVGISALERSTLVKKMRGGDVAGACNELSRWVYAGGRKLKGLVRRREAERHLCLKGLKND